MFITKVNLFLMTLIHLIPKRALSIKPVLHGYDFYASIGSPKFISAPMVDQSSLSFRLLVKKYNADIAFSQMMHARNFQNDPRYRSDCIDWEDYSHFEGDVVMEEYARKLDSNLIVQLAGDDPQVLVNAGKFVEHSPNVAALDLNLGCPQKIAKRGNYGAYLLKDKTLVLRILKKMVAELSVPVTVKIRRLATDEDTLDLCRAIEDCGVSMLTVHGRTVENAKLYVTEADWDIIGKIKQAVRIPVVANGGISCRADALECLAYTGADAVMSSEALLENPKLFNHEGDQLFRENYVLSQIQTAKEYLQILQAYPLPRPLFQVVRGHLFKFLYRFVDAPLGGDLRKLLAEGDFEDMKRVVALVEERLAEVNFDTEAAEAKGLINHKTWYMRHRDEKAAQRVLSPRRKRTLVATPLTPEELEAAKIAKVEALRARLLERKKAASSEVL